MQSTTPASIRFFRISPSPDWFDDIDPLASTNPRHTLRREVVNHVLHPGEVRVPLRRHAVPPALVLGQPLAAPVRDVERRIRENEVRLEVWIAVVVEGVAVGDLSFDPANGQVHLGESPRGVVRLLAVDREMSPRALPPLPFPVAWARMNSMDWTNMPEEPQPRIVDTTPIWLQHLDEQPDDAAGSVELATLLALGARELRKEVLIYAPEHVLGTGLGVPDSDVAHHVDQLAKAPACPGRARA